MTRRLDAALELASARRAHEAELREALFVRDCDGCELGRDEYGDVCAHCLGTRLLPVDPPEDDAPPPTLRDAPLEVQAEVREREREEQRGDWLRARTVWGERAA